MKISTLRPLRFTEQGSRSLDQPPLFSSSSATYTFCIHLFIKHKHNCLMLRNNNRKPLQMHHQIHTLSYSAMLCKGPSVADVVQVNLPLCVWCCKNCGSGVSLSILQLKIVNSSTFNQNNQQDAPIERKALSCRCRSRLCLLQLWAHLDLLRGVSCSK